MWYYIPCSRSLLALHGAARLPSAGENLVSKLLTLKEIAKTLDIPESSLRKYREIFSDFIPSVGSGRSRRYKPEAVEILREIRRMREEMHLPWDAVSDQLAQEYAMEIHSEPASGQPSQTEFFQQQQTDSEPDNSQAEESQQDDETTGEPAPRDSSPQHTPESRPAADSQEEQSAVAPTSEQFIKRISAISEKQAMTINAVAAELMRSIEQVREETRRETRQMHGNVVRTLDSLSASLGEMSEKDRELLEQVSNRIDNID